MKNTTVLSAILMLVFSSQVLSKTISVETTETNVIHAASNAKLLYPAITHTEEEAISNDVLFFYSQEAFEHFGSDYEALVDYVNGEVSINNDAFRRQDIALRRNIVGLLPLPDGVPIVDSSPDHEQKLNLIKAYFDSQDSRFHRQTYRPSYVSAVLNYYPENGATLGLGQVSGYISWISPGRGTSPTWIFSHESGHNDGLVHSHEEAISETFRDFTGADFAAGYTCANNLSSIMTTLVNANQKIETFFSSPLAVDSQDNSIQCGVENESDAVRFYKESVEARLPEGGVVGSTFEENSVTPPKTGTVDVSVVNATVERGSDIFIELLWQGATLGNSVQVLLKRDDITVNDVDSMLTSFVYDGDNIQTLTIPTHSREGALPDGVVTVSLIYPNKINTNVDAASVTITSSQVLFPGEFAFTSSAVGVSEGGVVQLSIERTNGADGEASLRVKSEFGTATAEDFTPIDEIITFADGETMKTISINTTQDDIVEPNEDFTVTLNSEIATIGEIATVRVSILNDDVALQPGVFNISTAQLSVNEGSSTTLTVNRTSGSDGEVSITVSSANGTASSNDYVSINETLVFADGETSKTIQVSANNDSLVEQPETFTINLSSPSNGGVIGNVSSATVTIVDKTTPANPPPVSTPPPSSGGGGGSLGFSVILLGIIACVRRWKKIR